MNKRRVPDFTKTVIFHGIKVICKYFFKEEGKNRVLGRGEREEGQLTRVIVYPDLTSLLSSTSRELKYLNIYQ
jgi:hypothetical protein